MADPETSSKIVYSPSPGSYAVIRLNPVAMVEPLGDYQALLQARSMHPKLYLVCLYLVLLTPVAREKPTADDCLPGVGASVARSAMVQVRCTTDRYLSATRR